MPIRVAPAGAGRWRRPDRVPRGRGRARRSSRAARDPRRTATGWSGSPSSSRSRVAVADDDGRAGRPRAARGQGTRRRPRVPPTAAWAAALVDAGARDRTRARASGAPAGRHARRPGGRGIPPGDRLRRRTRRCGTWSYTPGPPSRPRPPGRTGWWLARSSRSADIEGPGWGCSTQRSRITPRRSTLDEAAVRTSIDNPNLRRRGHAAGRGSRRRPRRLLRGGAEAAPRRERGARRRRSGRSASGRTARAAAVGRQLLRWGVTYLRGARCRDRRAVGQRPQSPGARPVRGRGVRPHLHP